MLPLVRMNEFKPIIPRVMKVCVLEFMRQISKYAQTAIPFFGQIKHGLKSSILKVL